MALDAGPLRRRARAIGPLRHRPPGSMCAVISSLSIHHRARRTAQVLMLMLGTLLLTANGWGTAARAATESPGIGKDTEGTALFSSTLTTPHAVRASDGRWHL